MPSAMKLSREMGSSQFAVKIGPQELGHIITLRKNLDYMSVLARFAGQYLKLGWPLAAREAHTGEDLNIDFTLAGKYRIKRLMDESLKGRTINLAVRLGASARLFAVQVNTREAPLQPDRFDPWRSTCVAAAGALEQHFFLWPDNWKLSSCSPGEHIAVLGEGALAPVPPSLEAESDQTWRWLRAPWESLPCLPPSGLCELLKERDLISGAEPEPEPSLLTWKELFPRIARHRDLLSALLAPSASGFRYYQEIITEALKAGIRQVEILQALLWHAPHGEARRRPDLWGRLLNTVAQLGKNVTRPQQTGSSLCGLKRDQASQKPLLAHLAKLTARTLALERQLAALQETPPGAKGQTSVPENLGQGTIPLWKEWLALIQRPGLEDSEVQGFRGAVAEFLRDNPDLAGDAGKLILVRYCYTNYIKIDPSYAGLPERVRLGGAGELARSFLESPQVGANRP